MSLQKIPKYWLYQIVGWGASIAISIFFVVSMGKFTGSFFKSLVITNICGLFISHIMRFHIHKLQLTTKQLKHQVLGYVLLTILYSIVFAIASEAIDSILGKVYPERMAELSVFMRIVANAFNAFWFLFLWNVIYFFYHSIAQSREQQLNTLKLEAMVKSLELKTIKSHINPHFIFNALNSIRALVDENPGRARQAITELSNILRSSLRADKLETVPLEDELHIVQDYLALEHMRFEERLDVQLDVDEDTLQQQVPPMMLQTLVENAIKHGISKQMEGGSIQISSKLNSDQLHISIINTGAYQNGHTGSEGFGIKSTQDRLNMLYNGNAHFAITGNANNTVTCSINLPKTSTF